MRIRGRRRSSPSAADSGDGGKTSEQPPLAVRAASATTRAGRRAKKTARAAGETVADAAGELAGTAAEVVIEVTSHIISGQ